MHNRSATYRNYDHLSLEIRGATFHLVSAVSSDSESIAWNEMK